MKISELVHANNLVEFDSYRQGYFYYSVMSITGDNFLFPVPLDDIGTATMLKTDKSIVFMRWIRKAITDKTIVKYK